MLLVQVCLRMLQLVTVFFKCFFIFALSHNWLCYLIDHLVVGFVASEVFYVPQLVWTAAIVATVKFISHLLAMTWSTVTRTMNPCWHISDNCGMC